MIAVKWYPTLHPTTYSSEGDQMCPTQGRLHQFQWGGSRSPVTRTRPPIPPSNTTLQGTLLGLNIGHYGIIIVNAILTKKISDYIFYSFCWNDLYVIAASLNFKIRFLPRDAMLARYMLSSCVRPSVHLSVRHTPVLYSTKMAKRRTDHKQDRTIASRGPSADVYC